MDALQVELLGDERDRVSRVGTESAAAYDLYLEGRHYWQRRYRVGLETALEYFERALEQDPEFALAHAGIAEVYWILGIYGMEHPDIVRPRAIEASRRAVELGPHLAESHCARGVVLGAIEYDPGAGVKAFERALELDPGHARAEAWRANYLTAWRDGDLGEAETALHRSVNLEPESIYIRAIASLTHLFADRFADASREAGDVLRKEPEAVIGLWVRGLVHLEQGEHEAAVERLERAAALAHRASFALALLGQSLGRSGRRGEALDVLKELGDRRAGNSQYVAPVFLAMIEAPVGRREQALEHVEEHFGSQQPGLAPLIPAGVLDVLRGEPRFDELLEEAGFR